MWGIHNDVLGQELIDGGFVSIGWAQVGDLRVVGVDRTRLKSVLETAFPEAKAGAIPVWAGVLHRFAFKMQVGDLVIAPYKPDSTLNFGVITSDYEFDSAAAQQPHRRRVRWTHTGISRGRFPQEALYEIGSALTLFRVRRHRDVFLRFIEGHDAATAAESSEPVELDKPVEEHDDWAADEPSAARVDQFTRDFVLKRLLADLEHQEFEEFTADLLRAIGYQARVTPYVADGGVDVIAHKDPLGLEPPLIKVQCKHTTATQSRPSVQGLIGTLSHGELGLFVTLGPYSKDAADLERERQNLRLLTGADVVALTLNHYTKLSARWRQVIPLRQVYVVDRDAEGR